MHVSHRITLTHYNSLTISNGDGTLQSSKFYKEGPGMRSSRCAGPQHSSVAEQGLAPEPHPGSFATLYPSGNCSERTIA
jgi:hypothetical protein